LISTKISPEFEFTGQRSRSPGTKKCGILSGAVLAGARYVVYAGEKINLSVVLVMAALWNRAGHYISALWFLSIFLSIFSFPRPISAAADWMRTILLTHGVALVRI